MKKAILSRFTAVVLLALILNGGISYYAMGRELLKQNITHMKSLLGVIDYSVNYDGELQAETDQIHGSLDSLEENARITILDSGGRVWADTAAGGALENHLEREEIKKALTDGTGYATRYSETLGKNMLYVARRSENGEYILRIAVPFAGLREYMRTIFPLLLPGMAAAFLFSIVIGLSFTDTVTKPLYEISEEMKKARRDKLDFHFKRYRYEELNVIADATKKLSGEVGEYLRRLEEQRRIRQEFFSNASHELKTPVTSVRGYAELLANGLVPDEETKADFIKRILRTSQDMTNLIDDILMVSRLETREARVAFAPVRLDLLLGEIFETLQPIAADYAVRLERECAPAAVMADAEQIKELLNNLIVNGIKYNRPGGTVRVSAAERGGNVQIRVTDDGIGISEEDQKRVFERFYRADKGRSRKAGGTGLGLSIVKHIVEFYGGSIVLRSEIGKGSEFEVWLPAQGNASKEAGNGWK